VNGYDPYGSDPRARGTAPGRAPANGHAIAAWEDTASTPTDLRERAARLIETRDEAAALRAAELYLQEADRVFAEAAHQFSQAQQLTGQLERDRSQLAASRSRLARDRAQVDQQRHALEEVGRELALARESLLGKQEQLEAMQEQLEAMENEQAQRKGRRRQPEDTPAPAFPNSGPISMRPNPGAVRTAADFLQCLQAFRLWTGNRSLRQISEQSGGQISASGARNIFNGSDVPSRLVAVDAIITGCGGSDTDRAAFAAAWRRVYLGQGR
jgi:hypothetical protein